jgi:hypothetical protein
MAQSGSTVTLKTEKQRKLMGNFINMKNKSNLHLGAFFFNKHNGIKLQRHKSACKPPAV